MSERTLKRIALLVPGWDCIRHPCGRNKCGEEPGANHGIHCDEWNYGFSDGEIAITLQVFTTQYPASVPPSLRALSQGYRAVVLGAHTAFSIGTDDEEEPRPCQYVDTGRCFGNISFGQADPLYQSFNPLKTFEQPEEFWRAFQGYFEQRAAQLRQQRVWPA
jgi:hypothetical protein